MTNEQITPVTSIEYNAKAYSNPYTSSFKLELSSDNDENVDISVFDMLGKLLTHRNVCPTDLNSMELGEEYLAGVYNVIIRQGNDTKIIRMIKR